jgi:Fe-S cluster biogenesis protein NfuA
VILPQLHAWNGYKIVLHEDTLQKIATVLESLRPTIRMDGGDLDFVRYEDTKVYVRFSGACIGCPMSMYTLKMGIESALKNEIPDITEVIAVD